MSKDKNTPAGVSRRDFLKISSVSLGAVPLLEKPKIIDVAGAPAEIYGPGKVSFALNVNGKKHPVTADVRTTLLDALRNHLDYTGAKPVCDRGTCGACTVLLDGNPVYACSVLAIDAQGSAITTVEGLGTPERLAPIQAAFVENDAQQCGFCTPGFVVACHSFLERHPEPSDDQIDKGLAGNICRCGTYQGIRAAVKQVAKGGRNA
jgi:xanthine dehydrogenase YagT iron-sulfur-binding subunit